MARGRSRGPERKRPGNPGTFSCLDWTISRILSPVFTGGWPSIWDDDCSSPRASYQFLIPLARKSVLALAPERVCHGPALPSAEKRGSPALPPNHVASLFTFRRLATVSIVSVALSLGLRRDFGRGFLLLAGSNDVIIRSVISWPPLAALAFVPHCCGRGVRTFLPDFRRGGHLSSPNRA